MTASSIKVEVGFTTQSNIFQIGASLLGGATVLGGQFGKTWVDVSPWIVRGSVTSTRGSQRSQGAFWRAEAGGASFTLDNNDGSDQFNPLNLSGPYVSAGVSQCRPGVPVRISVDTGASSVPVFFGFVNTWTPNLSADVWSTVTVSAVDTIDRLQNTDLDALFAADYAGDTASTRIGRLLDRASWDVNARSLSTNTTGSTMQATAMAQPVWTEVLLTADSDGGLAFQDRNGSIVYKSRADFPTEAQYTFDGTTSGGYEFTAVETSFDRAQTFNLIKLARAGGVTQTVEDTTSSAPDINGVRSFARTDLICEDDADVMALAGWLLYQFADLKFRIEAITIDLLWSDTPELWSDMASMEIGNRLRVVYPTPSSSQTYPNVIDTDGIVRGLAWAEHEGGARLTISLQTTPTAGSTFIVGTSLLGGVDVLTPF